MQACLLPVFVWRLYAKNPYPWNETGFAEMNLKSSGHKCVF